MTNTDVGEKMPNTECICASIGDFGNPVYLHYRDKRGVIRCDGVRKESSSFAPIFSSLI